MKTSKARLPSLLLALCLLPQLAAQGPQALRAYQEAILEGKTQQARKLLAKGLAADRAGQALLEAATLEPAPRAQAMLQICRIHPEHEVTDTALVAGCAALLQSQFRQDLLPELEEPEEDRELPPEFDLGPLIHAYRDVLKDRRTRGGDPEALAEASWMLKALSVSEVESDDLRVASGTRIPVPSPLAENMALYWYPYELETNLLEVYRRQTAEPIPGGRFLEATYGQWAEAPKPGVYVMELRSLTEGWSRLRRVIVSDLTVLCQSWPGQLVAMVSLKNEPAEGAELVLRITHRNGNVEKLQARTDHQGLCIFKLPKEKLARLYLRAQLQSHVATLTPHRPDAAKDREPQLKFHLMMDRPLYRPGEKVQGRVLIRHHDLKGQGYKSSPLGGQRVELRFWPKTKQEKKVSGQTDGMGVLTFALELPISAALGSVPVELILMREKELSLGTRYPCRVSEFRRPVVLPYLSAPSKAERDKPFTVRLQARYAAGALATGLRARLGVRCLGLDHRQSLLLDQEGKAEIPIRLHELPLPRGELTLRLSATFHSPEGQILHRWAYVEVPGQGSKPSQAEEHESSLRFEVLPEKPVAGDELRVRIFGQARDRVLLTVVRDLPQRSHALTLDQEGHGELRIPTLAADYPGLWLWANLQSQAMDEAETISGCWYPGHREHVELGRKAAPLELALEQKKEYAPGEEAEFSIRLSRAGKGVAGSVAVSIVDQTLYQLESDRTSSPGQSLRPHGQIPSTNVSRSLGLAKLYHILGKLLTAGSLPEPEEEEVFDSNTWARAIGMGGGAGGKFGGRRGGARSAGRLRKNFQPTAYFVGNLQTDADGHARFRFTFPDDLTTWRITAVAVDYEGEGIQKRFQTDTRLPLSLTAVLPRLLRQKDRLEVALVLQQQSRETRAIQTSLRSRAVAIQVLEKGEQELALAGKTPTRAAFTLTGEQPGTAKLLAAVSTGELADRAELPLEVKPDQVLRPVTASVLLEGKAKVQLSRQHGLAEKQVLRLYGNRDALLQAASEYLEAYPHGCVEQVLSRLTPLLVAARAGRLHGTDAPALNEEQGLRVETGMVALRQMLVDPCEGFSWWRGGRVNQAMTALAMHALVLAKEGGIDPERYGVVLAPEEGELLALAEKLLESKGKVNAQTHPLARVILEKLETPSLATAELVVASLRYSPKLPEQKQAVLALVEHEQALPAGLLARAGLALLEAGEKRAAQKVLERLLKGDRLLRHKLPRGLRFPGEAVAARTAQLLELILRLDPKHKARPRTVASLLGLALDGRFGSTYATAQALQALALDAEIHGQKPDRRPIRVQVRSAGRRYSLTLAADNDYCDQVEIPGHAELQLEATEGRQVYATLGAGIRQSGSDHPGWTAPIQLTRQLYALEYQAAGEPEYRRLGKEIGMGKVLELRLEVSCKEDVSYLVLECPLPAGFEVLGRPSGWQIRDDRVVRLVPSLESKEEQVFTLRLVAAHRGEVAWPPATVQAMYVPELSGACPGRRLEIHADPAAATPREILPLLTGAYLQETLQKELQLLRAASLPETAHDHLRRLVGLFDIQGAKALGPHATELIGRHCRSSEFQETLAEAAAKLPEAKALRRACGSGDCTALGVLLFAYGNGDDEDRGDGGYLEGLAHLLAPVELGGLSYEQRRSILLPRFEALVAKPWHRDVERHSQRQGVQHSDGPEVAPVILAWQPVLEAAAALLASQKGFGEGETVPLIWWSWLRLPTASSGAAAGSSLLEAQRMEDPLQWQMLRPLLENGGRKLVTCRQSRSFLSRLTRTKDKRRLVKTLRTLLTTAKGLPDRGQAQVRVLRAIPSFLIREFDQELIQSIKTLLTTAGGLHDRGEAQVRALYAIPDDLGLEFEQELIQALGSTHARVRQVALGCLPRQLRLQLTPATILGALAEDDFPFALWDLGQPGRQALLHWLRERKGHVDADLYIQSMGEEELQKLPLAQLEKLANSRKLLPLLHAWDGSNESLAQELRRSRYGPWRSLLVEALASRGYVDLPEMDADDPLGKHYQRLLLAWKGNADATLAILRKLKEDDRVRWATWDGRHKAMPKHLRRVFLRSLTGQLLPKDLLRWGDELEGKERECVLARLQLEDWRWLLENIEAGSPSCLDQMPAEMSSQLRTELLALARRLPNTRWPAVAALLRSKDGESYLRRHLRSPGQDERFQLDLARQVFEYSGRPVRYLSGPNQYASYGSVSPESMATRIVRSGFTQDLGASERKQLQILLRRRGILLP